MESLPNVNIKFNQFVDIVRKTTNKNYMASITNHDTFEQHCIIDCELVTLCLNDIMQATFKKKRYIHFIFKQYCTQNIIKVKYTYSNQS